jgi:ABC-2 type transport system permease protein
MIIAKNVYVSNAIKYDIDNIFSDNLEIFLDSLSADEQPDISVDRVKLNGEEPISSSDYYSIGMMAMFILFGASQGSVMLLKERKEMTYDRMAVAGVSKINILLSKYIVIFMIVSLQMLAMISYAAFVLKVNFVNINLILLTSIIAAFAVSGMGILMGAVMFKSQDYKLVGVMSNGVFQVLALLGGSYIPIEVMPKIMQSISYLPINGLVVKSFLKIMTGYGLKDIVLLLALLMLNGVIMFTLGAIIFDREVRKC